MKHLLAVLLCILMLIVLVPATGAEGADYTLVIEGGATADHLVSVDGEDLLAVAVTMRESVSETVFGVTFDLGYDPSQLAFVKSEADEAFSIQMLNDTETGSLRLALISVEGIAAVREQSVLTLYFDIAEGLEAGTVIELTLADGATVETTDAVTPVEHSAAADISPYILVNRFDGVVRFNDGATEHRHAEPYMIWNQTAGACEPAFTVYEKDGQTVIGSACYDYVYRENEAPGIGYLIVTFKGIYAGTVTLPFAIYLPATSRMTVENTADGIRLNWSPVEGAAGYVVYRRAWDTAANRWTYFSRWDTVTGTTYLDGHDADHPVLAGTRYQYSVKAYFTRRVDPVSGEQIGGGADDPYGNACLGMTGPLRTTVRIHTAVLTEAVPGTKEMTVKWEPSALFTGCRIQYATDANFTQIAGDISIDDAACGQTTVGNLTSGKTYYVRLCFSHLFELVNYYGQWSNVLTCTVQ